MDPAASSRYTDGSSMYSKIGSVSGSVLTLQADSPQGVAVENHVGRLQVSDSDQTQLQTTSAPRSQSSSIEERLQQPRQKRRKFVDGGSEKPPSTLVKIPKLWLLCQLGLVGAFALICVLMRALGSAPYAAERGVWAHLVFHTTQMSVCQGRFKFGCLENEDTMVYRTTGEEFAPLIHKNYSLQSLTSTSHLLEVNARGVRFKESAAYRVFGQVKFVDHLADLPVRLTIMVNGDYWMHCQMENQAPATRCVLYGVRYLRAGDILTFKCAEKYRLISVAPQDTYFSIEMRS